MDRILIKREIFLRDRIIGRLYILKQGEYMYFCDTLEPNHKVNHGCVPVGLYHVVYRRSSHYGGLMPYLVVPSRSGIMFHSGNIARDTMGCILIGNQSGTCLMESRKVFHKFMAEIKPLMADLYVEIVEEEENRS